MAKLETDLANAEKELKTAVKEYNSLYSISPKKKKPQDTLVPPPL